ncbi:NUDIX hydrolase [Sporosarcina sp. F6_3S_P_2]|uniref:NUDIX hydrolase n=1 Tax=Sporosarcina highlanderae TaxID=3035916 RepID=A0ABT8JT24_9BACL|nr:NUDIX hydrolase [Sporosarcina highlanderae]MDN4608303.1 NUDIX hydrolase [Sporosarcina highlanderae]
MEVKRKVLAYITKGENTERKILVFDQKGNPEAGLQVPGGTIEEDELLIDALYREIEEETGIRREQLELRGKVHKRNYFPAHRKDVMHERNIFHLVFIGDDESEWDNLVKSEGQDNGMIFHCQWLPIYNLPQLAAGQDEDIEFIV